MAGMHFFNPVPLMRLVEVIRGFFTSDETVQITSELAKIERDMPLGPRLLACGENQYRAAQVRNENADLAGRGYGKWLEHFEQELRLEFGVEFANMWSIKGKDCTQ